MDEIWERAVETALDGQTDCASARTLTLDGAVKCLHGRLPAPSLLEKFQNLQHLSIANIGVSSLEQFPRLRNLQKLILSDNRIAGGLEHLVEAGLDSLRDLDLSNNRIQYIEDLAPLAQLKVVSLDLYECPVTRVKDYRARVFGLIKSLKYLDKMDAEENERPESDDEEEDDEEEDEEDDPGSGEIDGEERPYRMTNGHSSGGEGIVDVDEDEESDADEEETETSRRRENGSYNPQENGFRVEAAGAVDDEDDEDGEDEEENESVEEIDEDDGEDEDVVEVHDVGDSDDEEDGDEEFEDDDEDDDDDDEVEEVDNDDGDLAVPESTGRLISADGEIDGHEQGEDDDDEDDNGETGEEELGNEDEGDSEDDDEGEEEEEDEDGEEGYLVQRVAPTQDAEDSDMEAGSEGDVAGEGEEVEDDDDDLGEGQVMAPSTSEPKRKRDDADVDDDEDDDDDGNGNGNGASRSSKKHH